MLQLCRAGFRCACSLSVLRCYLKAFLAIRKNVEKKCTCWPCVVVSGFTSAAEFWSYLFEWEVCGGIHTAISVARWVGWSVVETGILEVVGRFKTTQESCMISRLLSLLLCLCFILTCKDGHIPGSFFVLARHTWVCMLERFMKIYTDPKKWSDVFHLLITISAVEGRMLGWMDVL